MAEKTATQSDRAASGAASAATQKAAADAAQATLDATPSHDLGEATEHSEGGIGTRHDALDIGVPMLPGSPDEPQGPEDALGPGPKRGDYRNRIGGSNYQPHRSEVIPNAKPGEVAVRMVAQRDLAEDIGDEPGLKGGVETGDPRLMRGAGRSAVRDARA